MKRLNELEKKEYLSKFIFKSWYKYQREFRLRPVLSVIRDIIENENIIENFITIDKVRM